LAKKLLQSINQTYEHGRVNVHLVLDVAITAC